MSTATKNGGIRDHQVHNYHQVNVQGDQLNGPTDWGQILRSH